MVSEYDSIGSGYDRVLVSDQVSIGAGDTAKDSSHSGAGRKLRSSRGSRVLGTGYWPENM